MCVVVRELLAALALPLVLVLAGCSTQQSADGPVSGVRENNPDGFNGIVLPDPWQLPDLTLTDSGGADYDLVADTTKPLTLVFFGYTRCPDICLVILSDIAAAIARLPQEQQEQVGMLLITSDPARDDPETIRTYLDRFNPDFEGVTAPIDTIEEIGLAVGVDITKGDRLPSGGYEVAHGTQVLAVVPGGAAPLQWQQGTTSAQMAEDITQALTEGIRDAGADPSEGSDS